MLQEFIVLNREEIIKRCRAKVMARVTPPPTDAEIDHGVPLFLEQLIDVLRFGQLSTAEIRASAVLHGLDLRLQGFTVGQVVHDYGDVCQSITELAIETRAPIATEDFHTLNRCLDDAIACAVTEFGRGHQSDADGEARGGQRLGFFAHELRNLTNSALVAFQVLKTGNVGVGGSTGAVLHRSLTRLTNLIGRSLAEVRLTQGIQNRERLNAKEFLEEVAATATMEAQAKGIAFCLVPGDDGVAIEADRQVLAAVMDNLLQNAFKFTRPHSTVTLRYSATAMRVHLDVEDECGGLLNGDTEELFHPFKQRAADRTGLGLGLAFSRWGVEANNGTITTHNIAGRGCVFTVDLPRVAVGASVTVADLHASHSEVAAG